MANNTPNYALVKPAYNEWADITVLNNNLDIIDTQIFDKASKTRQIIAGLGLTGGGDLTTDRTLNIASANAGIAINADNIELKPATTSIIGGVKPDGTTTSVDVNGVISTVNRASTSTQIIAGLGLTGGGDISTSRTLNIVSANDGIIANADNIQLDTQNTLTSTSTTKPLSANMGKVLQDTKLNLTGGTLTGALNGTTATFSGNVTAPRLIMTSAQATGDGDAVRYDFANSTYFTNNPKSIPANTNLNTFLTKGHYTSVDNAITATMFNTPFGSMSFTLVVDGVQGNNLFISQLATYYIDGTIAQRITLDAGITWTPWTEIINKTTGDATYVKKTGDTMTGGLTATALAATNGTGTAAIYAKYNNLATDQVYLYNNSTKTGIYSLMPTYGELDIISRSKSTGVVAYAGGNYGTINGSTATFSGNVTAPNIITDTSIGTCTTLFSGTQQCGQATWKDSGIDIPTKYSSVVFEATTASDFASQNFEFSRAQLASGNYVSIAQNNTKSERIIVKIIGNRLWTYADGGSAITDNNLLKVYGITRR